MPYRSFNILLVIIVAAYIAAGWGMAHLYGAADRFSLLIYSRPVATTTLLLGVLFLSFVVFRIMLVERPVRLTRAILDELQTTWLTGHRIKQGLPVIIIFLFFMAAFTSLKTMIPLVQPYGWDETFMKLDRLLHGGIDPWALLQPVLGYPLATFIVNFIYNMWFPVMFGVLYWQAFSLTHPVERARFFIAFFLCWIVNGTVLAMVFSSVGPCFYGDLLPALDNPFQPLMAYLHDAAAHYPVWALTTQKMLWAYYTEGGLTYGSGIAAMPSLHVSIALLNMLLAYRFSRAAGHVFAGFFAMILLGSVHLGWHYAADGYLSIITTLIIWWGTGYAIRRAYYA